MQRRRTAKRRRTGGKTGDKRRQKTKTAGFSVLRVTYESVFCLNELLQQLRVKRGRACVRRVQRGRDHVTLTRCNVLKNRWMWMQILLNVIFFFHAGGWQQPNQSSLWNYSRDFTQTLLGSEHFVQKSVNVSFFFVFSQTGCIIKDDI